MYIHAPGVLASLWADVKVRGAHTDQASLRADHLSFAPCISKSYVPSKLPARFSYPRARAVRKLVLRSDASLDSDVCGHVPSGRSVMVLKESGRSDGRVLVGEDFAAGVKPLGWATREKDGEVYMAVEGAPRTPGSELLCSPKRSNMKMSLALRHGGSTSPRKTKSQQALEQISNRSAPGALGRGGGSSRRGRHGAHARGGHPGASSEERDQFLRKLGEAEQRDNRLGGLISAAELRRIAEAQLEQASEEEEGTSFETFGSRIGRIIIKNELQVNDLAAAMDRNGDKSVTRFEFCVGIRKLLDQGGGKKEHGGQKEREDIEDLFDTLDLDRSGELDLSEVKASLKKLVRDVQEVEAKKRSHVETSGVKSRAVAAACEKAAQETEQLAQAEELLARMRHPDYSDDIGLTALEAKLGTVLRKKNLRVGDIIREWDQDNR